MWVRIGSFHVKPDEAANLSTAYNELAVPKVRGQPGNIACVLLEPESTDEQYVAITIWEDRKAAEAYEATGTAAEVVALVGNFFAGPPTLKSYATHSKAGLPL